MKIIHAPTAKRLLSLALSLALFHASAATAQGGNSMTLGDFEAQGYVAMDDINTPLLHHVHTGEPYDLRVLARGDSLSYSTRPHDALRRKANSDNEFDRRDANVEWNSIVQQRLQLLRNARGYLIPLNTEMGEYDFANQRFPITLRMSSVSHERGVGYHCPGAYGREGTSGGKLSTCLTASIENEPFLRYFSMPDLELARHVSKNMRNYDFFALAEPAGKYRRLIKPEATGGSTVATSHQPARITGLLLVQYTQGESYLWPIRATAIKQKEPAPATAPADTTAPVGKMQKNPTHTSASSDGQSNWKLIAQSKDIRNYSDAASVRREGPTVVVRQMMDYREGFSSDFRSTIGLHAYNCNRRTMKLISVKSYKGSMGEGALFEETTESIDLGSPTAGSVGEANFNFACNAYPVNP